MYKHLYCIRGSGDDTGILHRCSGLGGTKNGFLCMKPYQLQNQKAKYTDMHLDFALSPQLIPPHKVLEKNTTSREG